MNHENFIEIPPNPSYLIQSLRYIGYTLDTALADIIDNSLSAGASQISVTFRWNSGKPWIAILDNGCGMGEQKLREAMRFGGGASPQESRELSDLGRFGLGLKTASLSQCRQLTVLSKRDNEINALEWDVDMLAAQADSGWRASRPSVTATDRDECLTKSLAVLEKQFSGTAVIWRKIDGLVSGNTACVSETYFSSAMSRAQDHIRTVFHRYIFPDLDGEKETRIDFNGTVLKAFDPFGTASPSRQELPEEILHINGQQIHVQPFVLPHYSKVPRQEYEKLAGEDGYLHNQGFYIYRNKRLIFKGSWFRLVPRTELTKLVRVRVDVPNTLDSLWKLDVKKSQAQPPKVVLDELRRFIDKAAERGKLTYIRRAARISEKLVPIWQREFSDGKVAYTINTDHPLAKTLVENDCGDVVPRKLLALRVIAESFPREAFHADSNTDKIEFSNSVDLEDQKRVVEDLINALHDTGLSESDIHESIKNIQMPLDDATVTEIIRKRFYG